MKKIGKIILVVMLVFGGLTLVACSTKSYEGNDGLNYESPSYSEKIGGIEKSGELASTLSTNQLIIYNYYYNIQTKDFDRDLANMNSIIRLLGGYSQSNNVSYDSVTGKPTYAHYTFRVPSDKLESFDTSVDEAFKVTRKNIDSTNITERYVSNEARIQVLNSARTAYIKLLEDESLTFSEIIQINDKINNIDTELLNLQLLQNRYDNELEYSYVDVTFYDGSKVDVGFFSEYVEYLGDFFVTLFKVIMYAIPFALVLGAITCAIVIPIVRSKRKKNLVK